MNHLSFFGGFLRARRLAGDVCRDCARDGRCDESPLVSADMSADRNFNLTADADAETYARVCGRRFNGNLAFPRVGEVDADMEGASKRNAGLGTRGEAR